MTATKMSSTQQAQGSVWHRWDPHIHAPGTVLNDQYSGDDPWEQFLTLVEKLAPPIRAIGITDYYNLDCYEAVLERKKQGRLTGIDLIFPNVELRYGIGTGKNSPVNFHLLISPEDPEHLEQSKRFLRTLTFEAHEESFRCENAELIRLGRACDNRVRDDKSALAIGANQFKVNHEQFKSEWKRSTWARKNILIAVAGNKGDGSSGLQGDSSLNTLRREIERTAHIIFSADPKQRLFWSGKGSVSAEELNAGWNGRKPCVHGSDAHELAAVGAPALNRCCWIKGDLSFESLRQICLEPETRVHIGAEAPRGALPSQVINSVNITNAPWLKTPTVPLNSGLVGIIGARGSGKTALADMIAAGGSASSPHENDRSFISRAKAYLGGSEVRLSWKDGNTTSTKLRSGHKDEVGDYPSVQYLSQQFVDRLCSAEGVTDELLSEVERVVYQAHDPEERMGAVSFDELLAIRTMRARSLRKRHEEDLGQATQELNVERERKANLPALERQRAERSASIAKDKRDRRTLTGKNTEVHTKQFEQVSAAAEDIRFKVEQVRRQHQALLALQDEVTDTREQKAPARLRQLQQANNETKLTLENWSTFLLDFVGDVDGILSTAIKATEKLVKTMAGPDPNEPAVSADPAQLMNTLLPNGAALENQTLSLLDKEVARLRKLIGIDAQNAKTFARLSEKISRDESLIAKLNRTIEIAAQAANRIEELKSSRRTSYAAIFDSIIEEETELQRLYEPLKTRLEAEDGALGKLAFSVRRSVDVATWAVQGEELLDLRKSGPFKGRGTLLDAAKADLCAAWEGASSADIADAMAKFRDNHEHALVDHCLVEPDNLQAFRQWAANIAAWLYSTDHIKISYGVQYDGVDIEQLSPGTRGIVLLLLYLAIDRDDDRPLIIDQPEENLDPKSIFDELVERFRRAKLHRQIIIVTHNANLIVNTDADQVIVADCDRQQPGELPEITYRSGSLENSEIRRLVCEILEGGEAAFQERAKRLRLKF